MEATSLKIYTYVDGLNDLPFPNLESQVVLSSYSVASVRMGIPVLNATLQYEKCLDDYWTLKEYVVLPNGELFWIKNIPSSSKNNESVTYKHEIVAKSDKSRLSEIYFIDTVQGDPSTDRYASNNTNVVFYGDIIELVSRLNSCFSYLGIGYNVVIDDGVTSEAVEVSFDKAFIMDVLQSSFNDLYKVPFYFVGNTIHFGEASNSIETPLKYGFEQALISVNKANANFRIITNGSGQGAAENIPYYYPNESPNRSEIEANGGTWITPVANLMPPIFRETDGMERFYKAENGKYINPDTGESYIFDNEYTPANRSDLITDFPEIKPTIKEAENQLGERMDLFDAFAYDENDSDEVNEDGEYIHPYFYARLRKTDGAWGFNLFDSGLVGSTTTANVTGGNLGACKLEIGSFLNESDGKYYNPVQVDNLGNIVPGDFAQKVNNGNLQPVQQDTRLTKVWIALKKDIETFGVIMPNVSGSYYPKAGDPFVLTNINLPMGYVLRAEKLLEDSIIKSLFENNTDKFNFSGDVSRVFIGNDTGVVSNITENSKIVVEYNGRLYPQYVNSLTYKVDNGEILPSIMLGLSDTLSSNRGFLQESINEVKNEIIQSVTNSGGGVSIIRTNDSRVPSDQNVFSALRSIWEITSRSISKIKEDVTKFLVRFEGGIEIGKFLTGMIGGDGARITPRGDIEGRSMTLRDSLIVPSITFNCVEVVSGDSADTFSFGRIKSVDTVNRIAELELLENQIGTLKTGDILRGIFHFLEGGNSGSDSFDPNGFLQYSGFSTSYFTPTQIIENVPGKMRFRYSLQAGTTVHPKPQMNFFGYGSFTDKDRQSMTYKNRLYTRRLKNVDTWAIDPGKNIGMQNGWLDGLVINGIHMTGWGTFEENSYMTGVTIQLTPEQKEELKGEDAYSAVLSTYAGLVTMDTDGNIIGGTSEEMIVSTGEADVVTGESTVVTYGWGLSTIIQASKGKTPLLYSTEYEEGHYMVTLNPVGCSATIENGVVSISGITDYEKAYVDILVNTEGNHTFELRYGIKVVKDGESPIIVDASNEFIPLACSADGTVLSPMPKYSQIFMYYGTRALELTSMSLSLPAGVSATHDMTAGVVTIGSVSKEAALSSVIGVTVSAVHKGITHTRTVNISLNKVLPGENGETPVIYELQPSVNVVKKDSSGNPDVSVVSCGIIKFEGSASVLTVLPTGLSLEYSLDSGSFYNYTLGSNVAVSYFTKKTTFRLTRLDASGNVKLDEESVFIVSDGTPGKKGDSTQFRYKNSILKPAAPTTVEAPGWRVSPDEDTPSGISTVWVTSAVISADSELVSAWSDPIVFVTDNVFEERIFILSKVSLSLTLPSSDPLADEYIGEAPSYSSSVTYIPGNIVKSGSNYFVCIKQGQGIATSNTEYWTPALWWTDDPTGSDENYPFEFTCTRDKVNQEWSEYRRLTLWNKYSLDANVLVPTVSQIGKTMTGNYQPEIFSVYHKSANGTLVDTNLVCWGSDDGINYSVVDNTRDGSSITIDVASEMIKYYIIRSYARRADQITDFSEPFILSTSVSVVEDGEAGVAGSAYRKWDGFEIGKTYRNDDGVVDLSKLEPEKVRYIDVILIKNSALQAGADVYIAKKFGGNNYWVGTNENDPRNEVFVGNESPHWIRANSMAPVFTNLIIANAALIDYAMIGAFLYQGDYMFSQQGVDRNGNPSSEYQYFNNPVYPFAFTDIPATWVYPSEISGAVSVGTHQLVIQELPFVDSFYMAEMKKAFMQAFTISVRDSAGLGTEWELSYVYYPEGSSVSQAIMITGDDEYDLPANYANGRDSGFYIETYAPVSIGSMIIEVLPKTFTPNFYVNGNTGDMTANSGTFTMRPKSLFRNIDLTSNSAMFDISVDIKKNINYNILIRTSNTDRSGQLPAASAELLGIKIMIKLSTYANTGAQTFMVYDLVGEAIHWRGHRDVQYVRILPDGILEVECLPTYAAGSTSPSYAWFVINAAEFQLTNVGRYKVLYSIWG